MPALKACTGIGEVKIALCVSAAHQVKIARESELSMSMS